MIHLIASKGLGDAIYMRALVLHLLARGEDITVFTDRATVFADLSITVKRLKERTGEEDIRHCMYCLHCRLPETLETSMFEMSCRQAGYTEHVELKLGWAVKSKNLTTSIKNAAGSRPVLMYQPPKITSAVRQAAFVKWLDGKKEFYRVKVGDAQVVQRFAGACDLDLFGQTTVPDLFDIASVADLVFAEPCYLPTLAEALDKPYVCMFPRAAEAAGDIRVRRLTPSRYFHKPNLGTAVYDD